MESIKERIRKIKTGYSTVIENYFYMTFLQVSGLLIGLLIYPYVIRKLGGEQYGLYVFAMSVVSYFIIIVSFGFNFPSTKKISENIDNPEIKNHEYNAVFTAKFYLFLISTCIFGLLLFAVPFIKSNAIIFSIIYLQVISELFFPTWYFQAIQKMKLVTYIQLFFRILTIPFIFIFIHSETDVLKYAVIITASVILGAISATVVLQRSENIRLRLLRFNSIKDYYKDAFPFFLSSSLGIIKQESVTIIIGSFMGMRDVAIYDLANKIISIPRMLTSSINGALFPHVIKNRTDDLVKKIIKYESIVGAAISILIVLFGYWVILLLGGESMTGAYPVAIVLSLTVFVWLVVGAFINFIFVPNNKYYYVTKNQFAALICFIVFVSAGLIISNSILVLAIAMAASGICEIVYCVYLIKSAKLI